MSLYIATLQSYYFLSMSFVKSRFCCLFLWFVRVHWYYKYFWYVHWVLLITFKQEDMLSPGRYKVANIIVDKKYMTYLQTDFVHQTIALFIAHRNVFIQTNQTFCIWLRSRHGLVGQLQNICFCVELFNIN